MRRICRYGTILSLLACLQFCICSVNGNAQSFVKTERILIILDASYSMQQQWQDSITRYKAASVFITQLMDSAYARNNEVEFALRAYGHQSSASQNDCYDTKLEVMYSMDNYTQMGLRLASLHARGITPVSFAINEALDYDMPDGDRYNYHLVIITDGGESCGGNLCAASKKIQERNIRSACIISVANDAVLKAAYSCLGNYQVVTTKAGMATSIHNMLTSCCIVPPLIRRKIPGDDSLNVAKKTADQDLPQESLASMNIGNKALPKKPEAPVLTVVPVPELHMEMRSEPIAGDTLQSLSARTIRQAAVNLPAIAVRERPVPDVNFRELTKPLERDTIAAIKSSGNKQVANTYIINSPAVKNTQVPQVNFQELSKPLERDTIAAIRSSGNTQVANTYTINSPAVKNTQVPQVNFQELSKPLERDTIAAIKSSGSKQVANTYIINSPAVKKTQVPQVSFKELSKPLERDTISSIKPSGNKQVMVAYAINSPVVKTTQIPEVSFKELSKPLERDTIASIRSSGSKQVTAAYTIHSPAVKNTRVPVVNFKELSKPLERDTIAAVRSSGNKQAPATYTINSPAVSATNIPTVHFKDLSEPLSMDSLRTIKPITKQYPVYAISKPTFKPIKIPKVAARKTIMSDTLNLVRVNSSNTVYNRDNLKKGVAIKPVAKQTLRTGYLKIENHDYTGRITFYVQTNGQYQYYLDIQINVSNVDQRFKLIAGKYKITFNDNDGVREFTIVHNKMTAVSL